jgi:hypothetical protein
MIANYLIEQDAKNIWTGRKVDGQTLSDKTTVVTNKSIPFSLFEQVKVKTSNGKGKDEYVIKQIEKVDGETLTFKDGTTALKKDCLTTKKHIEPNKIYPAKEISFYYISDMFSEYCTIKGEEEKTRVEKGEVITYKKNIHTKSYQCLEHSGETVILEINKIPVTFRLNQLEFSHKYLQPIV